MKEYVFVCIGTNKIISDSFGPRVGEKLKNSFALFSKIQVFGTMEEPVHFKNANFLVNYLNKIKNKHVILIDSALALEANIGETFVSLGGIEIGKAYGRSFYFPANINIKTVIANRKHVPNWNINQIDLLANSVASKVTNEFINIM